MVTYQIRYEAENLYNHLVQEAFFEFLVLPCNDDTQEVVNERVRNSLNIPTFRSRNIYGFETISVRINQPFDKFNLEISCAVKKKSDNLLPSTQDCLPLEEEIKVLLSSDFIVDNYLYIQQTKLTAIPKDQIPAHFIYRKDMSLLDFVNGVNTAIFNLVTYTPGVTNTKTTAKDVLHNPQGVCQDYSHLMLGILRHNNIPCRYVSGYLNQGHQFMGSSQMHAWVEVLIPNLGWIGLDPTNNLMTDPYHIKVANGTDYTDCSPLKGHIKPGGYNTTEHIVNVLEQSQQQNQQQ